MEVLWLRALCAVLIPSPGRYMTACSRLPHHASLSDGVMGKRLGVVENALAIGVPEVLGHQVGNLGADVRAPD